MARTTDALQPASPADKHARRLASINRKLLRIIVAIKSQHPIIRDRLAHALASVKHKNNKADSLHIKHVIVSLLDVVCETFDNKERRAVMISQLDLILEKLSKHHNEDGYAKSARHAFIAYYHKLLRRREKLPEGMFRWFESYTQQWQQKILFGEHFDFNRWKVVQSTDVLRTHRDFSMYPKKGLQAQANAFSMFRRENSDSDLVPVFDDTDESDSQYVIGDVMNDPLKLIYFLIEYNILNINKNEFAKLRKVIATGTEQDQVAVFNALPCAVFSKPLIRIMGNSAATSAAPSQLTTAVLNKLESAKVPLEILYSTKTQGSAFQATHLISSVRLEDPDGKPRVILYANAPCGELGLRQLTEAYDVQIKTANDGEFVKSIEGLNAGFRRDGFMPVLKATFDNAAYNEKDMPKKVVRSGETKFRISYFNASKEAGAVPTDLQVHVTNLFAPLPNTDDSNAKPYVLQRVINPKKHHFELLKSASIRLLENYLSSTNVANDRLNNAMWLLYQIQHLPANDDSFTKLHALLNKAKKTALEWDAAVDSKRFSFFRRHRFGSRYIEILDDLRERTLFAQADQDRQQGYLQGEQDDLKELQKQFDARKDDDHAKRYLAKQIDGKEKLLISAFGLDDDAEQSNSPVI